MSDNPPIVLCVDDDSDDQLMVSETIMGLEPSIIVAKAFNGLEALQYLNTSINEVKMPCLIIMDINMPLLDGKQTLVRIKKDERLKNIPVVMFTTSDSILDKTFCDQWGVEFMTKPVKQNDLRHIVEKLLTFCSDSK
jgi:CheY-like chemotaxis protein